MTPSPKVGAAGGGVWAGVAVIALYALAGGWLAMAGMGYRIEGVIDPQGAANPLRKVVVAAPGAWLDNYARYPWMALAPLLGFVGSAVAILGLRKRSPVAMAGSGLAVSGIVASVGASMFPFMLPSSLNPGASLTVWDSSSSHLTLFIMLVVTAVMLPIVLAYTAWVFKVLWGRLSEDEANAAGNY